MFAFSLNNTFDVVLAYVYLCLDVQFTNFPRLAVSAIVSFVIHLYQNLTLVTQLYSQSVSFSSPEPFSFLYLTEWRVD